jgi:hypothetical protein
MAYTHGLWFKICKRYMIPETCGDFLDILEPFSIHCYVFYTGISYELCIYLRH